MKFVAALITAAIAFGSSVLAVDGPYTSASEAKYTTSTTAAVPAAASLKLANSSPHAAYAYAAMRTAANAIAYTYNYQSTFSSASQSGVAVPASASATTTFYIEPLTCALCNSGVSTSATYTWDMNFSLLATPSATQDVFITFYAATDSSIGITSGTPQSLAPVSSTYDPKGHQPGKLLFYAVTAGGANYGSGVTHNLTITSNGQKYNPFKKVWVTGNSKCPVPVAGDNIDRQSWDFSATLVPASTTFTIANSAAGTFWVYLQPNDDVAAGNTVNALTSADTLGVSFAPLTANCTNPSNGGFCSSIATFKSVAGIAAATVMAAAFLLF